MTDEWGGSHHKRIFRVKRKINVPGVISHVTQRAAGAERLFHEDDDYLEMLVRMKHVSETYKIEFISFVLMSNHVHLLLYQTEANLDEAMRELFARYALRFNRKYERKGHLFGGPYRQAVCLDDAYAITVSLYIHLNPVRAGLVSRPTEYRWSSCRLFTQTEARESFVTPNRILEWLSNDSQEARSIYWKMLEAGTKQEVGEVIEDPSVIHRFQWGLTRVIPQLKQLAGLRKGEPLHPWALADIEESIAAFVEGEISPMPRSLEARKYLVEQLVSRGFSRKEISGRLGVSRKSIYNLLTRPSKY